MSTTQNKDPFEELHRLEETFYQDGYRQGHDDGSQLGRVEGRTFGSKRAFERFFDMSRMHGHAVTLGSRVILQDLAVGPTADTVSEQQGLKEEGEGEEALLSSSSPLPPPQSSRDRRQQKAVEGTEPELDIPDIDLSDVRLRPLKPPPPLARLEKHVRALYALTEPGSLSVTNDEEAVSDFDDRFRRAQGKETIIRRMGAGASGSQTFLPSLPSRDGDKGRVTVGGQGTSGTVDGAAAQENIDDLNGAIKARPHEANIEDTSILKARH